MATKKQLVKRQWFYDYFSGPKDPNYITIVRTYRHMMSRCYDEKDGAYRYYGARGIRVDDRWLDIYNGMENFIIDMGVRPSNKHSLDRIDVNDNYSSENCRWTTKHQQMANTTRNNSFPGVIKHQKGYRACIQVNGKSFRKLFKTFEDAASQRLSWEVELLGKNIERVG